MIEACKTPKELSDFLKGPLAAEEESAVSRHLFQCQKCRDQLALLIEQQGLERRGLQRRNLERRQTSPWWNPADRRFEERRQADRRQG